MCLCRPAANANIKVRGSTQQQLSSSLPLCQYRLLLAFRLSSRLLLLLLLKLRCRLLLPLLLLLLLSLLLLLLLRCPCTASHLPAFLAALVVAQHYAVLHITLWYCIREELRYRCRVASRRHAEHSLLHSLPQLTQACCQHLC